jgi:hypothetical protein
MKMLLFLLLSFLTYAQSPYPDTLFLKDGRTFPCLLTQINESRVEVFYSNDIIRVVFLPSVQRISLEEFGTVYSSASGFVKDLDSIQAYIDKRSKGIEEEVAKNDSLMKNNTDKQILALNKKWSFGILLIPDYSGTMYNIFYNTYPSYEVSTYGYKTNQINMEGQFSYSNSQNTRITFNIMFISTSSELKEEYHSNGINYYTSGDITTRGLDLIDLSLGFKYYFLDFSLEKITAYMLGGIGKQFAFVKNGSKDLYNATQSTSSSNDNEEEYLGDLNSPWHLNLGFGVEYFFNESLTLTSVFYFQYSNISATYNYRSQDQTSSSSKEYSYSEIVTQIGVGANFYF